MKQCSLDVEGFKRYHKATRREVFLTEMNRVVQWTALCALVEPAYPKAGARGGHPHVGLERMPRLYFLAHHARVRRHRPGREAV